jgi:hypothetical protein
LSTRASGAGAEGAVAEAAVDTAIPERRHAANTSRLDAVANGSSLADSFRPRGGPSAVSLARTLGRESVPTSNAAAKNNAAQLMSMPAR